ncbi:ribosome recycling factor [Candidatus Hodgkinia cicadicola]|nr:ribosome recycling factor [Candidatus Hodgkinia cicadicola]
MCIINMLDKINSIKVNTVNSLQLVVNKFRTKSSLYFVDKITISMISHILVNNKSLGTMCSFRQLLSGGIELLFFNSANIKNAIKAIRMNGLGLRAELKSGSVYVHFANIISNRRISVARELLLILEQFKLNVRTIRRRAISELKEIKAVECDLKRLHLKQIEDSVFKALHELQQIYDFNEHRLSLSC